MTSDTQHLIYGAYLPLRMLFMGKESTSFKFRKTWRGLASVCKSVLNTSLICLRAVKIVRAIGIGVLFWREILSCVRSTLLWRPSQSSVQCPPTGQMRAPPPAPSFVLSRNPLCIITAGENKCCDIRLFNPLSSEKCILSRSNLLSLPVCSYCSSSAEPHNYSLIVLCSFFFL